MLDVSLNEVRIFPGKSRQRFRRVEMILHDVVSIGRDQVDFIEGIFKMEGENGVFCHLNSINPLCLGYGLISSGSVAVRW